MSAIAYNDYDDDVCPPSPPQDEASDNSDWSSDSEKTHPSNSSGYVHVTRTLRPSQFVESGYHALALSIFVGVKVYEASLLKQYTPAVIQENMPSWFDFGGRLKYLTFINVFIQLSYFLIAFLSDILPESPVAPLLTNLREIMFSCLAAPLGIFVTLSFWSVYLIDPEGIWPKESTKLLTPLLNHAWHTIPGLLIILEIFLIPHKFLNNMTSLLIVTVWWSSYVLWIFVVYLNTERWVYPFLHIVPVYMIPVLLSAVNGILFCIVYICSTANAWLWTTNIYIKKKESKI